MVGSTPSGQTGWEDRTWNGKKDSQALAREMNSILETRISIVLSFTYRQKGNKVEFAGLYTFEYRPIQTEITMPNGDTYVY